MIKYHERTVPSWRKEIDESLGNAKMVLGKVENRMEEFMVWINHFRETNRNEDIPVEVINSLQELIQDTSAASSVKDLRLQVEEISLEVHDERSRTNLLRSMVFNLQDKLEEFPKPSSSSSLFGSREDISHQDDNVQGSRSTESESSNLEREIVRKGIERLEKQISQLIEPVISKDQVDIALLKRCKTVDVPAVNSAIGNIQKALQKYVGFKGMQSKYCETIDKLMDKAQNWCLKIEQEYNKAEVHSINTSKGDTEDVGTFSDNSEITVFEFLEAAELAYLGWGNSVQKANRLCNCN